MNSFDLNVIKYIAEEVDRQGDGPLSVYHMVNAWGKAQSLYEDCENCLLRMTGHNIDDPHEYRQPKLTLSVILYWGHLVAPDTNNRDSFRRIPIGINDPNFGWMEKAPWERVPTLLEMLIDSYYEGEPDPLTKHRLTETAEDQFYFDFENIHPFRDGNGRTGKIIYNYLKGTLDNPQMPPNFWGSSNP